MSHDDDLLRVTGRKLEISKLDYDELPPLSTSLGVTFASPGNGLLLSFPHLKVMNYVYLHCIASFLLSQSVALARCVCAYLQIFIDLIHGGAFLVLCVIRNVFLTGGQIYPGEPFFRALKQDRYQDSLSLSISSRHSVHATHLRSTNCQTAHPSRRISQYSAEHRHEEQRRGHRAHRESYP